MNYPEYDHLDVDAIVVEVEEAVVQGKSRTMSEQEMLPIRFAALNATVKDIQARLEALESACV